MFTTKTIDRIHQTTQPTMDEDKAKAEKMAAAKKKVSPVALL